MEVILSRSIGYMSIVMLVSMAGCGSRPAPPEGGVQPPNLGLGGDEFEYKWDDEACLDGAVLGNSTLTATVSSWENKTRQDTSVSLEGLIDQTGHFNKAVFPTRVTDRMRFSRKCDTITNERCLDSKKEEPGFTGVADGQTPRFCRVDGNYSVDSIERITLTSALALKHAQAFAKETYKDNGDIPPVHLLILPRFESVILPGGGKDSASKTRILVNNLAYFPSPDRATPYIAVFPRDSGASDAAPRLWEAPFVFSHEYGHHLERAMRIDRFDDPKRSLVRGAVSEAFADLNGFATDNLTDATIRNIPCMGADRSVAAGSFRDSIAKIFDDAEMRAIESHSQPGSTAVSLEFETAGCSGIAKYAMHGIGAIFAYNVNMMLGLAFDAVKIPVGSRAKNLGLSSAKWLKETDRIITIGRTPRADIIGAARALENVVKDVFKESGVPITGNIAEALCQRMQQGFIGTGEKTWFGRDCSKSTTLTD